MKGGGRLMVNPASHRQRGVALGGLITWCVIIGFGAILVMRFWPLINQKMKVDVAMKQMAEREDIGRMTTKEIYDAILRNFEVQDVDQFNRKNIKNALSVDRAQDGKSRLAVMQYEIRGPLFSDFDIVLNYRNEKTLPPLSY